MIKILFHTDIVIIITSIIIIKYLSLFSLFQIVLYDLELITDYEFGHGAQLWGAVQLGECGDDCY